jgi:hypothetical protein
VVESTTIRPLLENRKTPIAAIAISLTTTTSTIAFASGVGGRAPAARKAASDDRTAFIDSLARKRLATTSDDISLTADMPSYTRCDSRYIAVPHHVRSRLSDGHSAAEVGNMEGLTDVRNGVLNGLAALELRFPLVCS